MHARQMLHKYISKQKTIDDARRITTANTNLVDLFETAGGFFGQLQQSFVRTGFAPKLVANERIQQAKKEQKQRGHNKRVTIQPKLHIVCECGLCRQPVHKQNKTKHDLPVAARP